MKKASLSALLALATITGFGTASAAPVTFVADQLRTAGGTLYTKFTDGSDGGPVSTATWDWNGTTLTQTGGVYYASRRISNLASGLLLETDQITGLVISTSGGGSTTATAYDCIEGTFGASTGSSICGNIDFRDNSVMDSTLVYNVGGNADCISKTIGGDDVDGGPLRGLTTHAATDSCVAQNGAYMRWNATLAGNILTLNNGIDPTLGKGPGNGGIQFTFNVSEVPVPAAAWFIGPAAGLLVPWTRRRKASAA